MLAAAAAAATGIQVGAAMVATRFVIDQTSPATLAMLRYIVGFLCLLPFVLMAARVRLQRRDILPIALLGIGQFGILIALLNFGLQYIPAGRAALLFATLPLQTMMLAAVLGLERLSAAKTAGVLLTIAGVALAIGEGTIDGSAASDTWIGTLAVLASAFCGAVCSVFYQPYLKRYAALPVSAFAMLASVAFLAAVAGADGSLDTIAAITPAGWSAVLFIGFSSGIGYVLWLWALAHTTPTRVTIFLTLSPLTAALLGAALLDEPVSAGLVLGLLCVATGLWLANRTSNSDASGP